MKRFLAIMFFNVVFYAQNCISQIAPPNNVAIPQIGFCVGLGCAQVTWLNADATVRICNNVPITIFGFTPANWVNANGRFPINRTHTMTFVAPAQAPIGPVTVADQAANTTFMIAQNIVFANNNNNWGKTIIDGTLDIFFAQQNNPNVATPHLTIMIDGFPTPVILSSNSVCVNSSISATGTPAGGVWNTTSPNISILPGNPNPQTITGINASTNNSITYTVANPNNAACTATSGRAITVDVLPTIGTISGPNEVCEGSNIVLTPSKLDGVWSSANPAIATAINGSASTGIITGISPGTVDVVYTFTSTANCVSTKSVNITVKPKSTSTSNIVACNSYTWATPLGNGNTYTASGTYTNVSINQNGCDHTEILNLTINSSTTHTTSVEVCDSYTWAAPLGDGNIYTTSGTYTHVSTNQNNCTHTETLILTIKHSTTHTTIATACDSFTWAAPLGNGNTYTASGIYAHISINENGCTHTETLNLTINLSTTHTTTAIICSSYTWPTPLGNGNTYTTSGTYTHVSVNENGCQHIETLNLTISPLMTLPPITGKNSACKDATTQLSNSHSGGIWSSNNTSIATVSGTGLVTGVNSGDATISYSVTGENGCMSTVKVEVAIYSCCPASTTPPTANTPCPQMIGFSIHNTKNQLPVWCCDATGNVIEIEWLNNNVGSATLTIYDAVTNEVVAEYLDFKGVPQNWGGNGEPASPNWSVSIRNHNPPECGEYKFLIVNNCGDHTNVLGTLSVMAQHCVFNRPTNKQYNTKKADEKDGFSVYPNPVSNQITIDRSMDANANNPENVIVLNALGKQVMQLQLTGPQQSFDMGKLAKGLYVLSFETGKKVKFVKE